MLPDNSTTIVVSGTLYLLAQVARPLADNIIFSRTWLSTIARTNIHGTGAHDNHTILRCFEGDAVSWAAVGILKEQPVPVDNHIHEEVEWVGHPSVPKEFLKLLELRLARRADRLVQVAGAVVMIRRRVKLNVALGRASCEQNVMSSRRGVLRNGENRCSAVVEERFGDPRQKLVESRSRVHHGHV